jgi:hypothetical protein
MSRKKSHPERVRPPHQSHQTTLEKKFSSAAATIIHPFRTKNSIATHLSAAVRAQPRQRRCVLAWKLNPANSTFLRLAHL